MNDFSTVDGSLSKIIRINAVNGLWNPGPIDPKRSGDHDVLDNGLWPGDLVFTRLHGFGCCRVDRIRIEIWADIYNMENHIAGEKSALSIPQLKWGAG